LNVAKILSTGVSLRTTVLKYVFVLAPFTIETFSMIAMTMSSRENHGES
jgi:hypothetical protein